MTTPAEYRAASMYVSGYTDEQLASMLREAAEQAEQLAFLMSPQSGVMEKAHAIVAAERLEEDTRTVAEIRLAVEEVEGLCVQPFWRAFWRASRDAGLGVITSYMTHTIKARLGLEEETP